MTSEYTDRPRNMRTSVISLAVAAAIMAWAPLGSARQTVALPYPFGDAPGDSVGQATGLDTTGSALLTVRPDININSLNDVGGGITSDTNDGATILFEGNSTVTGFTGTSLIRFNAITAGANATTVNFNGDVFTTTFNHSGTGTVNFNGNLNFGIVAASTIFNADGFINIGSGQTFNSAITTLTAGTGTLTLNSGSSVIGAIGGASGLKQVIVSGGNASVTGAVQSAGFTLGANTLNINGALTTNAGGTIATTLAGNTVYGNIVPTGASNIDAGGITVFPTVTGVLTPGTQFTIVDGMSGTIGATVTVDNTFSPLYTFSAVPTVTGDVVITVVSVAAVAPPAAGGGAAAILGTPGAPGSDLLAIQTALLALPDAASVADALLQLSISTTNLAAPLVARQATHLMDDILQARVEEIQGLCCDANCKPDTTRTLRNCKDDRKQGTWWGKAFGHIGNQDDVDERKGYDTDTYGLVLAYDRPVSADTRIGAAIGYANSSIDGNNTYSETNIDSYQVTGYVNYTPGPWYVQGALTAGIDRYDGERQIMFTGVNRIAKSDYDGQHYSATVTAGKHIYFDKAVTVTPFASLEQSLIKVDGYTERGAGDVNHRVSGQDYNLTQAGLGVKVEKVIQSGASTYSPEAHAKWLHDFDDSTTEQTAAFTGGGAAFKVQGIDQDRDLYNVGAGITFLSCNCDKSSWTVKGQYDYNWNNSHYKSNQVSIIASLKF